MASVTLTAAMRANLLSLQSTASLMGNTQYRLATGLKVNSALDNPSSYFAAQGLNSRASDLSSLLDGMGQSIQTLKAADEGIKSMTTLLQNAKAVAQTAKTQPGAPDTASVTSAAVASGVATDLTTSAINAGDSYTFQVGTGPLHTFTVGTTGDSLQELADFVNSIDGLEATIAPSGNNFTITVETTNGEDLDVVFAAAATGGGTDALTLDGTVNATGGTVDYSAQIAQYDDLRTQLNSLIADAGYRGINLLSGDTLITQFNETNTSSSSVVSAQTFTAAGLGITAASGWASASDIDDAIEEIDAAVITLKNEASKFGNALSVIQARQDFTTNLVNVLKDGASALTIADKNEEGANMLSLQTAQQLGIQALSLASQANQSVLRLFQ